MFNPLLMVTSRNTTDGDTTPQDYIAFYPLTGTAEDVTGDYDGTEVNELSYIDDTARGSVANFTINSKVTTSLTLGTTSSVTFWAYITDATNLNALFGYIPLEQQSFLTFDYAVLVNGVWVVKLPDGEKICPNTNEWYFITIIDDGSNIEIRTNDSARTNEYTGTSMNGMQLNTLGYQDTDSIDNLEGMLSSMRIYDRALTAEEVTTIYNYELANHHIAVDDGLIAYYPLHNNSMDNYFNQYDCTDNGSITYDGLSANFDGSSYIETINPIDTGSTSYSISCWFKTDADIHNVVLLDSSNILWFDGNTKWTYYDGTDNREFTSYVPQPYTLYYITLVIDNELASLYLDSTFIQTVACTTHILNSTLTMGCFADHSYYVTGELSNLRIYNRAITEAEIITVYNAEKGEFE